MESGDEADENDGDNDDDEINEDVEERATGFDEKLELELLSAPKNNESGYTLEGEELEAKTNSFMFPTANLRLNTLQLLSLTGRCVS